jgi:YesN/AraC family two-component response regulator
MITMLIVDDERIIRDSIESCIDWAARGIDIVLTAQNGVEAMNILLREPVDMLITDVRMPKMDGIELATNMRKQQPGCKLIFLSAYADKPLLKSAIHLGAISFVEKPVKLEELLQAVDTAQAKISGDRQHSALLSQLNGKVSMGDPKAAPRTEGDHKIAEITRYIEAHIGERGLTAKAIAGAVYLSHSYLCMLFKKSTGMTLNAHITSMRMGAAKALLGDKAIKLSDIAARVGYTDAFYFSNVFKKYTGSSPSEYRRNLSRYE